MKPLLKIIAGLVVCLLLLGCNTTLSFSSSVRPTYKAYQQYTYYQYDFPTYPSIPEFTFTDFVLPTIEDSTVPSSQNQNPSATSTFIQFVSTPGTVRRNQMAYVKIKGTQILNTQLPFITTPGRLPPADYITRQAIAPAMFHGLGK